MSALVAYTVGGEELGCRAGERAEAEGTKVLRVERYNADRKTGAARTRPGASLQVQFGVCPFPARPGRVPLGPQ